MRLIYSYTIKIGNYPDNEWQMKLFRASMIRSKELGYVIKLYGCHFTYEKLHDLIDEYVDIEDKDFQLTDDLKLYIHSEEDLDCITIDGDIILDGKLKFPKDCDMIYERKGVVLSSREDTKFKRYLERIFKHFDVESNVPYFNYNATYACSVGILKFNNQETKDFFLSSYYNFRKYYIESIEPNIVLTVKCDFAIIICEYLFACLLDGTSYVGKECNDINTYTHYMSLTKFTSIAQRHVESIINPLNRML